MKIFGIEIDSNKDNYSVKIEKKDIAQTAIKSYVAYQILKPVPKPKPIIISSINQTASEIDYDVLADAISSRLKWGAYMHYMDREEMKKIKERNRKKIQVKC